LQRNTEVGHKSKEIPKGDMTMAKDAEFFNVKYKEGSLDPKAAQLILFAVNLAIDHEHGAKLHLGRARELGASEDEIWETVVYAMRPVAAKVRNFAKELIAK
jgi:alkylhydroperoxidase/carboxymuconolactone decarboxylase family protein YurZ